MARYRKLAVAVLGLLALFMLRYFEVDIWGFDQIVLEMIVSALTAFGVYQARNDPGDVQ